MDLFITLWNLKLGGIQKHAVLLANYLVEKGWKVTILYKSKEGQLLDVLDSRVVLIPLSIPNTNNPWQLFKLSNTLRKVITKGAFVLCNGPNNFRQIARINLFLSRWEIKYILHNDLTFPKGLATSLKKIEIRVLANARKTFLYALSKKQHEYHKAVLMLNNIKIAPNFLLPHSHFKDKLNRENPKGVSIGRISPEKGYDVLIDATRLSESRYQIHVFGGKKEDLDMGSQGKSNSSTVIFRGYVTNPIETMLDYDFYVSPSKRETFGLSILEALSCGLPVLSTDCDGPLDMINENNGIIVARDDPKALTRGLKRMTDLISEGFYDPETIRKTVEKFRIDNVVEAYGFQK